MIAQIIINGLIAGFLWGLVALGFSIIYSTARFLHAAHAATYLVGAYTGILLMRNASVTGGTAILAAMGIAVALGILIEIGIYRPLRKAGSSSSILFLSSLASVIITQNIVGLIFGSEIQVARRYAERDSIQVLGARISSWQALSVGIAASLFIITWGLVRFTQIGRKTCAIATDPDLAEIVGINRGITLMLTICFGSALAGGAGFLICYDTGVTPISGFGVLLIGVTAAIVGGIGSIPGAMLGGLLVGIAQHLSVWKIPPQWQDAIVFLILILFLFVRPQGFLGKPLRKVAV